MIDFDARVNCSVSKAFGEEFLYEHKSGLSYPVTGVFHDGFRRQVFDSDGTPAMATSDPFVGVRMVELRERYGQNDILVRKKTGVRYRIAEPQPDGMGWINFKLKVSA
ncbi:hypothetical protein [Achromobacter sp. AONIH1]|uniref:head-tail joining protein n=1 Tax=Achromobacter sp. AONIH1 TaxID=1758194 RepID=UPI000CD2F1F5|nr:hypothetical protein [Achromobacter sp. AONIH1]AUT47009.1 hypothetical protein C2U31_14020 [Achromobacter sp. AONIH1]